MTLFYTIILVIVLSYLIAESLLLNRRIKKIPVRILVNGTRGKSTTVRLIYEIFNDAEHRVYARTTGDRIEEYFPDGTVHVRRRIAPANIIENVRVLYRWTRKKPEAIILESMVIQPELQAVLSKIFRPTHIIFTNFLPDHFEDMGPDLAQVRQTLLKSVYRDSLVIIPIREKKYLNSIQKNISQFETFTPRILEWNLSNIPQEILNESWGLVFHLCGILNLSYHKASGVLRKVWESINKAMSIEHIIKRINLINLFSVNDPMTARVFISFFMAANTREQNDIVLLNARRDRPLRTLHYLYLIRELMPHFPVWITGQGSFLAYVQARKLNLQNPLRIISMQKIIKEVVTGFEKPMRIFGLANFKGTEQLINLLITDQE